MHFIRPSADSWFNLPRDGGVAYAAQESWVQNETIRDNILFGSPYDETRYRKGSFMLLYYRVKYFADFVFVEVIQQCALEKDLELFDAGDKTEVGEKGLTLRCVFYLLRCFGEPVFILNNCSGGQKVGMILFLRGFFCLIHIRLG